MGKDEREGNSPSFFNPEEAATVTSYLKLLLAPSSKKGKARLSPRSVGVISPYRKQVRPSLVSGKGPPAGGSSSVRSECRDARSSSLYCPLGSPAPSWRLSCAQGLTAGEKSTCSLLAGGKDPVLHHQT